MKQLLFSFLISIFACSSYGQNIQVVNTYNGQLDGGNFTTTTYRFNDGTTMIMYYNPQHDCQLCNGTGIYRCPQCRGTGYVSYGISGSYPCLQCSAMRSANGNYSPTQECWCCKGVGTHSTYWSLNNKHYKTKTAAMNALQTIAKTHAAKKKSYITTKSQGTTIHNYGTHSGSSNIGGYNSTSKKNETSTKCKTCWGDGKCPICYGSGKCQHCNNGYHSGYTGIEENVPCGYCNHTGRCSKCNGLGRCPTCGGRGKL